ncbi:hypothetical protein CspHIS471_0402610 [Cutaneotrichosporon sp. HIS471]|nr:hypothetical protein CspHIS471_0402610 [Cutaneotrichosporon sp. HIS471]
MAVHPSEKEHANGQVEEVGDIKFHKVEDVDYVQEKGGNDGGTSYQIANGAPVEAVNPLGYHVGFWTSLMINVGGMIGTGIFSTPSNILTGTGSVGLALIYWVIGFVVTLSGVSVFLELASFFPSRSGAEAVYLEQAFNRPIYFVPITFAVSTVLLSFRSNNALVLAQYVFQVAGRQGSEWEQKGVAIASVTIISIIIILNTNMSLKILNIVGTIKLLTLIFIAITGFAVLGGHTPVAKPTANFHNSFDGTTSDPYGISNALVSIIYSFKGYTNMFTMVNEIKNPIKTIKRSAYSSTVAIFVLYFLVNIAYFAGVPKADLKKSRQATASLFFANVFGDKAAQGLSILPIISAAGNLLAATTVKARMIREIGRQGVLPYPKFWVTTRPFGSPIGSVLVIWAISVVVTLAPPVDSAFNFIVALKNWPESVFFSLVAIGLLRLRYQRDKAGLPRTEFRVFTLVAIFFILTNLFLIVMPWVPPKGTTKSPSFNFFYATPAIVAVGVVIIMIVYYWAWMYWLPNLGHYKLRAKIDEHEDGSVGTRLIKIPDSEVEAWDARHDPAGRSLDERKRDA